MSMAYHILNFNQIHRESFSLRTPKSNKRNHYWIEEEKSTANSADCINFDNDESFVDSFKERCEILKAFRLPLPLTV